jgi:FG-GAP repeat/WD40-like Beta Propeller Repeat
VRIQVRTREPGYRLSVRAAVAVAAVGLASAPPSFAAFAAQGSKLTGAGEIGEGLFGESVALSGDGNTALMGGANTWVFTRSGETWTQRDKLPGEAAGDVALSADGNTALIGEPGGNGGIGAVRVFARSGSTWSQQGGALVGGGEVGKGGFGTGLALSADGSTAMVGGPEDGKICGGGCEGAGAAWVFTRSGSTWSQQGTKLTAPLNSKRARGAAFGERLALSADGSTALIGSPGVRFGRGAAWVFTRTGSTWVRQGKKLFGRQSQGEVLFGWSVALSADGNTALIGGPGDDGSLTQGLGAAWVFTRSGSTWSQQGNKLTGTAEVGDGEAGESVSLSADGNTALIGGPGDNGGFQNGIGAAWAFTRSGSTWSPDGTKLVGAREAGKGEFGFEVALSSDGKTALIGAPVDNGRVGAAWVFTQ